MTASPKPTAVRRLFVSAGLVSADGTESSKIVRGRLTRFTLGTALFQLAATVVSWAAYAAKASNMPLVVPTVWTLAAVVMVATCARRVR
jgi:hypothetical protein